MCTNTKKMQSVQNWDVVIDWCLRPPGKRMLVHLTLTPHADFSMYRPRTILGVYRSVKINLNNNSSDDQHLRPPAIEKNFLISPPGSPPVGWEPIREDPPNPTPLAEDLIAALRKLQVHTKRSSREMLLEPEDGVGVTVYVEECGMDDEANEASEEDWVYGQPSPMRQKWTPMPTSLPELWCFVVSD